MTGPEEEQPRPTASAAARLVVHVAPRARSRRLPAGPVRPGDLHVHCALRRRPTVLDGADLVVAHGRIALLVALVRTRGTGVPVAYRPPPGVDRRPAPASWARRSVSISADDGDLPIAAGPPGCASPGAPTPGGLRIFPAATRVAGDVLLVARPDPAAPVDELGGSGPATWALLADGLAIDEAARRLAEASGASLATVEGGVRALTAALVRAGLAEPA